MRGLRVFVAVAAALLAGAAGGQLVVDGLVRSTSGGLVFPDGSVQTSAAESSPQVVVVAKSGGQFTTIQGALDAIGTTLPTATATDPYLIRIAPGVYTESVVMEEYVDIEGAGPLMTTISGSGAATNDTGTVTCADNSELRHLTVTSVVDNSFGIAIYCGGTSPRLRDLVASVSDVGIEVGSAIRLAGGSMARLERVSVEGTGTGGTVIGIDVDDSEPEILDAQINLSGGSTCQGITNAQSDGVYRRVEIEIDSCGTGMGVSNVNANPTFEHLEVDVEATTVATAFQNRFQSGPSIKHSRLVASGGTTVIAFDATDMSDFKTSNIEQSELVGADNTIKVGANSATVRAYGSQLSGGPVDAGGGTVECFGVFDEAYVFSVSICPS